mgnify:CR=1 FL=1
MGHKIHPTGLRLGITQEHRSRWYAPSKTYPTLLQEDDRIRKFIHKKYAAAGISVPVDMVAASENLDRGLVAVRQPDGRVVASIPIHIYWDLKKRGIADDDEAMKRWLNDSQNRFFRTRPGQV